MGRRKTQFQIRIVQASGPTDLASELEGQFLLSQLALSIEQKGYTAGTIQKFEVDFHRCSQVGSLVRALAGVSPTVVHLIAHASHDKLQVGLSHVTAAALTTGCVAGSLKDAIVVSTGCRLGKGTAWKDLFLDHLGASALICANSDVKLVDCAFFSTCFYGAMLGLRNGNKTPLAAAWDSFRIGYAAYRSLISTSTGFFFHTRGDVRGKKIISPLVIPDSN